jgi:hypothetical protein
MSKIIVPEPEQALVGLRAIKTVITAAGPLDATRRAVIEAGQKHVIKLQCDIDSLEPIEPDAVGEIVRDEALREQLSRAICLYVMFPDQPARAELLEAERFVAALGGPKDSLDRMRSMYEHRMIALRFDAMRSSFLGDSVKRRVQDEGIVGLLVNVGEILGVVSSERTAARYRGLADYPDGSLGRAFHAFYTERKFLFPGEKGGAPESIIAHDLTHVLTGYSTDLPGEACVTAFQAGYRREDPFTGLLFVLLNMEKGITMTKLAPSATHMFGVTGMAENIVTAWASGTEVPIDLVKDWDYWNDMTRPLAEVRAGFNISPRQ